MGVGSGRQKQLRSIRVAGSPGAAMHRLIQRVVPSESGALGPAPLSSSSFTTSVWCSAKCSGLDPWSPRYQGRHWPPAEIQPLREWGAPRAEAGSHRSR